jgi:protein gp37
MTAGLSPTGISWTHLPGLGPGHVLNPILGCQHAGGPGCDHCWAEADTAMRVLSSPKMAAANAGLTVLRQNGRMRWTGEVNFLPERLAGPLRKRERVGIFMPSKSDPWYSGVLEQPGGVAFVRAMMGLAVATNHVFMVLTKRPAGAVEFFEQLERDAHEAGVDPGRVCLGALASQLFLVGEMKLAARIAAMPSRWPAPNLWVGSSTERQEEHDLRAPHLRALRRHVGLTWLSVEPMLGLVELDPANEIGWVVVGGESGTGARPMEVEWVECLATQCKALGVPMFFKQLGTVPARAAGVRGAGEDIDAVRSAQDNHGALTSRLPGGDWSRREFPPIPEPRA